MAIAYESLIQGDANAIGARRQRALADLDQASRIENYEEAVEAHNRIKECDLEMMALQSQTNELAAAQRYQQSQTAQFKHGLTPEERETARKSYSIPNDVPPQEREKFYDKMERDYAANKAKLHRMRANGEYRQTTDQGG